MGARAWPSGCYRLSLATVPLPRSRLLGLRNSLRSDSPRPHIEFGTGAQPRPQAPCLDRHGGLSLHKTKTLDPLLDWIPDQVGDKRRG